ncbi:hypothetical protein ACFQ34_22190 [Pseudonocardia benzenivorans]|uniref:Uncharacterized protein n=1 Tax=Pseudonocardia benzenivorans TaxID=228005 RepID=A0ABW3VLT5_9PSEU
MTRARPRRRWGPWLAWPLVVAALVALEFLLLGDRITADVALVLAAPGDPARVEAPVAAPLPSLPEVPVPAVGGPVRAVDLRSLPGCTSGGRCLVRVQVLVDAGSTGTVSWVVQAHDLCTGQVQTVGTGTAALPTGADRIDAVIAVSVPAAAATALTASTTAPAPAAGPPLRVSAAERCGS